MINGVDNGASLQAMQGPMGGMRGMGGPGPKVLQEAMTAKLAEKTGMSEEELKASFEDGSFMRVLKEAGVTREDMDALRLEAIDELAASGEISSEQAERLRDAPPPRRGPPPTEEMRAAMEDVLSQLSETLGVEKEELFELIPKNQSIWDFAKENGVDLSALGGSALFDVQV